jgi:hypothetical protein
VNHLANPVQVVQAQQQLPGKDPTERQRNALVVVSLDHFKKVDTQDFEHHHEVFPVGPIVQETIKQLH